MSENTPAYGCDGCHTTAGRMSCPIWLGDSFAEIKRLQTEIEELKAGFARPATPESLGAERLARETAESALAEARKERDEARKALLWYGEHDCGAGLPDFVVSAYEAAADAARAAGEER